MSCKGTRLFSNNLIVGAWFIVGINCSVQNTSYDSLACSILSKFAHGVTIADHGLEMSPSEESSFLQSGVCTPESSLKPPARKDVDAAAPSRYSAPASSTSGCNLNDWSSFAEVITIFTPGTRAASRAKHMPNAIYTNRRKQLSVHCQASYVIATCLFMAQNTKGSHQRHFSGQFG